MKKILLVVALFGLAANAERLRGYGETRVERRGDDVIIHAQSNEKAALWAARFAHSCPAALQYYTTEVNGHTLTLRRRNTAQPAAAPHTAASIPMYMNEWDDFAFRFYYREGETPKGVKWNDYDPEKEFDWAKLAEKCGFIFWTMSPRADMAKGLINCASWNWGYRFAAERGLPIVLNTNLAVPMWICDEAREENPMKAPGYVGSYHSVGEPFHAGEGFLSWASDKAHELALNELIANNAKYNTSNVIELLEPHGELYHGDYTVFLEHGPLVDKSFREFLREKWKTLAAVAARWQEPLKSWDDVHLPAIADFAGGGANAIDLAGEWRGKFVTLEDALKDLPARNEWPIYHRLMPGHDAALFTGERTKDFNRDAVLARDFTYRKTGKRTWLYVWDLANKFRARTACSLNGKLLYDHNIKHNDRHWTVVEVTDALRDGTNTIALQLPTPQICYRIYLTHDEPRFYPHFAGGGNAKWADFCAWQTWSRVRAVQQGLEKLRAIEPDKSIVMMAPGRFFNQMRELARKYGGRFHDTGMTGATYWEYLPMLMRSADMPFSCEPGGPANDVTGLKRLFMLYLREGQNAIHYFIHIGCVYWDELMRAEFMRILPALKQMGQRILPRSQVALLLDSDIGQLAGYPWRQDLTAAYESGYPSWRLNEAAARYFRMDAVTPCDFANGIAARYPIILDSNNNFMTEQKAQDIANFVRAGGTFVAMFETGRHSEERAEQWLLKDLTGCEFIERAPYELRPDTDGITRICCDAKWRLTFPPSTLLNGANSFIGDGAKFRATANDVEVLAQWDDGSIAIATRKVGRGRIVLWGVRFPWMWETTESKLLHRMLNALGVKDEPLSPAQPNGIVPAHYLTTDGLCDIWHLFNDSNKTNTYSFTFTDGKPRKLTDVLTGRPAALTGTLAPYEFAVATSPREDTRDAAWRWTQRECGWWQGGGAPTKPVPRAAHDDVLPLNTGWDLAGRRVSMRKYITGRELTTSEYFLSRQFTVPASWTNGVIELCCSSMYPSTWLNWDAQYRLSIPRVHEGDWVHDAPAQLQLNLTPGQTYSISIAVRNDTHPKLRGFSGEMFLYYLPRAKETLDLSGEWEALENLAAPSATRVTLPGHYPKTQALRRTFILPKDKAAKNYRVKISTASEHSHLYGLIINGHYLRKHHHKFGERTCLDVTPWIKWGTANEVILVGDNAQTGALTSAKCLLY